MAKKVKDNSPTTEATTNPEEAPTTNPDAGVTTGGKKKRKAGKDIVPRLKVVEGQSFILMASSRGKSMMTALLWAPQPKDPVNPFLFMFELPSGEDDGDTMLISLPMELKQAQAVYAGHPRRVPKDEMPPECPLEEVIDPPKEPKKKKAAAPTPQA